MKNILQIIDKWGNRVVFILVVIVFFKTCTTNGRIDRLEKNLTHSIKEVDTTVNHINTKVITTDEMVDIIKETPFWKSLELEELSDKDKIPINRLKNDYEK